MEVVKTIGINLFKTLAVYTFGIFYTSIFAISIGFKWLWCIFKGQQFWYVKKRKLPPLCLQDSTYGRHSYIQLKDVKIHYVENGDRSKPLMLFVHGFPEFWFTWRRQLEYFSKTHWVVAIDMRGYGDSDKPTKRSAYKIELLQKDIVNFVKGLNREKCILIGHDWGGILCWTLASKNPDWIEKLIILNSPHPAVYVTKILGSVTQFLKSYYVFIFQLPFIPEIYFPIKDLQFLEELFENKLTEEELEAYKYNWSKKGSSWTPGVNYYRNALDFSGFLNPANYPKIKIPTLIVWGEKDIALDKDIAEMCKPFVENIKIVYIPTGNHFVQHHKPNKVNKEIQNFLST